MTEKKFDNILAEALDITNGDRQKYYGHPADNHGNTAALWSAYLNRKYGLFPPIGLSARDVCMMMVLLKVSRDANSTKRDNLVDIAGYVRNAEQIEQRRGLTSEDVKAIADFENSPSRAVTACPTLIEQIAADRWRDEAEKAILARKQNGTPFADQVAQDAPVSMRRWMSEEEAESQALAEHDTIRERLQPDDFDRPDEWHGIPLEHNPAANFPVRRREFRDRPLSGPREGPEDSPKSGSSVGPTGPLGPPTPLPRSNRRGHNWGNHLGPDRRQGSRGPASGPFSGPGRATEAPPQPG